ncbi:MAG: N-acyl-D-amino-acid deacylase family protein [Thermoguttaceae bacterium]
MWIAVPLVILALAAVLFLVVQRRHGLYDLVIENGKVFDGERMLPFGTGLAIRAGKIEKVGVVYGMCAKRRINAWQRIVSPGFIDTHVHVEANLSPNRPFYAWNFANMGVTTVITGNCGTSVLEVGKMLDAFDRKGGQVNLATLVGHNSIRDRVMKDVRRPANNEEIAAMRRIVDRAMHDGALGFSTGLEYAPGIFSDTEEVAALAAVAARRGGVYATHMRDEGLGYLASLKESLEVARRAQIPLHISHLKIASKKKWPEMQQALNLLDDARRKGLAVTQDVYAYDASSTSIDLLLPPEFRGNSWPPRSVLNNPRLRAELVKGMLANLAANGFNDFGYAYVAHCSDERIFGKSIPEVGAMIQSAEVEFERPNWLPDLVKDVSLRRQVEAVLHLYAHGGAQMIYHVIDEANILLILKDRHTCIGTDSAVRGHNQITSHPRGSGNFPRVLHEYVVKQPIFTWEEALRKMTSLPADIFSLDHRGRIREGYVADLVIFDPSTIADRASYDHPLEEPEGIDMVIVAGKQVVPTLGKAEFPGRAIRPARTELPPLPPFLRQVDAKPQMTEGGSEIDSNIPAKPATRGKTAAKADRGKAKAQPKPKAAKRHPS